MRESPLDVLLEDGVIDAVLGRLNSGKEADLFLVDYRGRVVAAKVYKDRAQRSFKNNADYKEGRAVRNTRTARAISAGSRFGKEAEEEHWGTTEARALHLLDAHGVRVPVPVMSYEGVLLMELVTDAEGLPAPRLIEVAYDRATARSVYVDLRAQIVRMLCCDVVHGDLSPYNILAGARGPTIIDFPQIVSAAHNSRAEFFFQRDYQNVLNFLAGSDPSLRGSADDGRKIWNAYTRRELTPEFQVAAAPPAPSPAPRHESRHRWPPLPPRGGAQPQQGPRPQEGPRPQGPRADGPRPQGPRHDGPRPQGPRPQEGARTQEPRQDAPRTQESRPDAPPALRNVPGAKPAPPSERGPRRTGPVRDEAAPAPGGFQRRRPKRRF